MKKKYIVTNDDVCSIVRAALRENFSNSEILDLLMKKVEETTSIYLDGFCEEVK